MQKRLGERFDVEIPRRLWQAVVGLAGGIVAIAAAVSVIADLPALTLSLILNAALLATAAVLAVGVARSSTARASAEGRASRAPATIAAAVPEAKALAEFLGATLFSRGTLSVVEEHIDEAHYLERLERNFSIAGTDIDQRDRYEGTNVSNVATEGLRLVTFGGRFVEFDQLDARAEQDLEGKAQPLTLKLELDSERVKIATITLARALSPGDPFSVSYRDHWAGAMEYGVDGVFYTPAYYFRQVGRVDSLIEFREPDIIESIRAYGYDTVRDVCELALRQPEAVDPRTGAGSAFRWSLPSPQSSALYFVMFRRHRGAV